MNKVICCPASLVPAVIDSNVMYFSLYSSMPPERTDVGHIALSLPSDVRKDGLAPTIRVWDFTTIALSVAAADQAILRENSADGWTRMIELSICLIEPAAWDSKKKELESLLRFLTGDFWYLHFLEGGGRAAPSE